MLEAPRSDYEQLLEGDRPGPNGKKGKAKRLRSFTLPSHLVRPNSAPKDDRYMNILLAVILKDRAFLVVDFSRMVVMNFRALHRHWCSTDFIPGSEVSNFKVAIDISLRINYNIALGENLGPRPWARLDVRDRGSTRST